MAKGPKTLDPASKARKEARKKELKKNKKQRQQVRSAVIESKDPEQILADLRDLDKLEFDVENISAPERQPGGSSDKLFKERRKRLKELWDRVISYYQKEDLEKYASLKKLEAQYETDHQKAEREFEAIRAAQEATIDDVILPPEPDLPTNLDDDIPDDDPLMSESVYITPLTEGILKPPGCPPGPPPDFKQLVKSLKGSLVAPPTFIAQTIPQNLLNFGKHKPKNFAGGRGGKIPRANDNSKGGHIRPHQGANSQHVDNNNMKPSKAMEETKSQSKGAVIESKPVIFIQKVTKFVPASVRSKVSKPGAAGK